MTGRCSSDSSGRGEPASRVCVCRPRHSSCASRACCFLRGRTSFVTTACSPLPRRCELGWCHGGPPRLAGSGQAVGSVGVPLFFACSVALPMRVQVVGNGWAWWPPFTGTAARGTGCDGSRTGQPAVATDRPEQEHGALHPARGSLTSIVGVRLPRLLCRRAPPLIDDLRSNFCLGTASSSAVVRRG